MITVAITFKCPVANCPNNLNPTIQTETVAPGTTITVLPPDGWRIFDVEYQGGLTGDIYCPRHALKVSP